MRLFEAEVGGAAARFGPPPPRPAFVPHSVRPAFVPHSVRPSFVPQAVRAAQHHHMAVPPMGGAIPPPPTYPRPATIHPTTARPGVTPLSKSFAAPQREYCAPPVISKPKQDEEDDVMATLLKYEQEVKGKKTDKPKTETISGDKGPRPGFPGMPPTRAPPPPPAVKPGTQVTPDEIKLKARQMVEMVKASQVIQTKRLAAQAAGSGAGGGRQPNPGDKPTKRQKKSIRMAGGQMWEDPSLVEWDPNDFRIFCGDLGNDVTDEVLTRTFSRYPSFQKAKVVRDKRSNKTKGYGFVSFKDPTDFTKAIKEMDGKYVGSRPIKLRKSNWKDRNIDQVKQKQKLKNALGYKV